MGHPDVDLLNAVVRRDADGVRDALSRGANINCENKMEPGANPLLHAVFPDGDLKVVKILLEYGADPNSHNLASTAIGLAARDGNLDVVKALLDAGANPRAQGPGGDDAFSWAECEGHRHILDYLRSIHAHGMMGEQSGGLNSDTSKERCPKCGFSFSFDGKNCEHCGYVVPTESATQQKCLKCGRHDTLEKYDTYVLGGVTSQGATHVTMNSDGQTIWFRHVHTHIEFLCGRCTTNMIQNVIVSPLLLLVGIFILSMIAYALVNNRIPGGISRFDICVFVFVAMVLGGWYISLWLVYKIFMSLNAIFRPAIRRKTFLEPFVIKAVAKKYNYSTSVWVEVCGSLWKVAVTPCEFRRYSMRVDRRGDQPWALVKDGSDRVWGLWVSDPSIATNQIRLKTIIAGARASGEKVDLRHYQAVAEGTYRVEANSIDDGSGFLLLFENT